MQRHFSYVSWLLVTAVLLSLIGLSACGGSKSSSGSGVPNKIVLTPTTFVSLDYGQVAAVFADVQDVNGTSIGNQKVTWSVDQPTLASFTPTGGTCGDPTNSTTTTCVCSGAWDPTFIDCATNGLPATGGKVVLKATSGTITSTVDVFVHPKVTQISITPSAPIDCISSTKNFQLSAKAFVNGTDVTANVGAFSWFSSDSTVVTIDNSADPTKNGLATAMNPGRATFNAAIANTSSPPGTFITCGVNSIKIHVKDVADTSFTVDAAATKQLAADVVDKNGTTITITNSRLNWTTSYPGAVGVDANGLATGSHAGTSGIVAVCAPTLCNNGLVPIYSNVVTGNINGTTASTVLVASTTGTSMVPIDISKNTVGTAVTLPVMPNSLMYTRDGSKAYLGSSTVLMTFDFATSVVSTVSNLPGVVLALSNNGSRIALYDSVGKTVSIIGVSGTTFSVVDRVIVTGTTKPRAAFSPDNQRAIVVDPDASKIFVSSPTVPLRTITLNAPAQDVAYLAQGSFAYLAGGESSAVSVRATCDNTEVGSANVSTSATPSNILPSVEGTKMFALTAPTLNIITATTTGQGCPPALTDSLSTVDLGQGAFNTTRMIVAPNGSHVYMLTDQTKIIVYTASSNTGSAITLSGGAKVLSGDITLDSKQIYVGGSDKNVHRIDTATGSDAQAIPVTFTPDLVAVQGR